MTDFNNAARLQVSFDKFEGDTERYRQACEDAYTNRREKTVSTAVADYLSGKIDFLALGKKIEAIELEITRFAARKTGHRGQYTGGAIVAIGFVGFDDEEGFAESIGLTGDLVQAIREGFQSLIGQRAV
jgi:hypothetical protein